MSSPASVRFSPKCASLKALTCASEPLNVCVYIKHPQQLKHNKAESERESSILEIHNQREERIFLMTNEHFIFSRQPSTKAGKKNPKKKKNREKLRSMDTDMGVGTNTSTTR